MRGPGPNPHFGVRRQPSQHGPVRRVVGPREEPRRVRRLRQHVARAGQRLAIAGQERVRIAVGVAVDVRAARPEPPGKPAPGVEVVPAAPAGGEPGPEHVGGVDGRRADIPAEARPPAVEVGGPIPAEQQPDEHQSPGNRGGRPREAATAAREREPAAIDQQREPGERQQGQVPRPREPQHRPDRGDRQPVAAQSTGTGGHRHRHRQRQRHERRRHGRHRHRQVPGPHEIGQRGLGQAVRLQLEGEPPGLRQRAPAIGSEARGAKQGGHGQREAPGDGGRCRAAAPPVPRQPRLHREPGGGGTRHQRPAHPVAVAVRPHGLQCEHAGPGPAPAGGHARQQRHQTRDRHPRHQLGAQVRPVPHRDAGHRQRQDRRRVAPPHTPGARREGKRRPEQRDSQGDEAGRAGQRVHHPGPHLETPLVQVHGPVRIRPGQEVGRGEPAAVDDGAPPRQRQRHVRRDEPEARGSHERSHGGRRGGAADGGGSHAGSRRSGPTRPSCPRPRQRPPRPLRSSSRRRWPCSCSTTAATRSAC